MTESTTEGLLVPGDSWQALLNRQSFIEFNARERALALADPGSLRELCGPFERLESPWLEPQGMTPQADDGTVIARARIGGQPVVIAAIDQKFAGGGTGEVSGAKISTALALAAEESRLGNLTAAVILFETGGVRLQEANLGLNAVAEICSALLDLRAHAPVVGVVAGTVGSFGGMSIAAGLCTHLVVTPEARIGLNGPAVIEQEAGPEEFDSTDHALIWAIDGGQQRFTTALADTLVSDDANKIRDAVVHAISTTDGSNLESRSRQVDVLRSRLASFDPRRPPEPGQLSSIWGSTYEVVEPVQDSTGQTPSQRRPNPAGSRGRTWIEALSGDSEPTEIIPSVVQVLTDSALYLAVVPDPENPYHRAQQGQVGLTESLALTQAIQDLIKADAGARSPRAIIAVVDVPSQAYGRIEEMVGLHQAMATTVDAYHTARTSGHPVITLVVGTALSGGFLTHGLQANQILALDDPGVEIHAMHKPAAARITLRTPEQLDELAKIITPMSYRVQDWATLGMCDGLLPVDNADTPTPRDIESVHAALAAAIQRALNGPSDLSNRLDSPDAIHLRKASRRVRDVLNQQWNPGAGQ